MKNLKRFTAIILAIIMFLFSFIALFNKSEAILVGDGGEIDLTKLSPPIYGQSETCYEFNAKELIYAYAMAQTGTSEPAIYKFSRENLEGLVPIHKYKADGEIDGECEYDCGAIDAALASRFQLLSLGVTGPASADAIQRKNEALKFDFGVIGGSLAKHLNISNDDVTVYVTVRYPRISGVTDGLTNEQLTIEYNSKTGVTEAAYNKALQFFGYNKTISFGNNTVDEENMQMSDLVLQQKVTVKAVGKTQADTYSMLIGKDKKFYLEHTPVAPTPDKFSTKLSYAAATAENEAIEGKMSSDGKTFLPPYYADDINKTDADAIATIESQTDENIVKINGIAVNPDGSVNEEGWYYPNKDDKKKVSKVYLFKTYDNEEDHGYVGELVKVEGEKNGLSTEEVSIKWTFRRKVVETKENEDKSITVTITYNLPIDVPSIPEGWAPIYDNGNSGACHKITKTIKQGEDYEKDVTVKQKGTDETNTTHVRKVWEMPKAGESMAIVGAIVAVAGVAVIARRKLK